MEVDKKHGTARSRQDPATSFELDPTGRAEKWQDKKTCSRSVEEGLGRHKAIAADGDLLWKPNAPMRCKKGIKCRY